MAGTAEATSNASTATDSGADIAAIVSDPGWRERFDSVFGGHDLDPNPAAGTDGGNGRARNAAQDAEEEAESLASLEDADENDVPESFLDRDRENQEQDDTADEDDAEGEANASRTTPPSQDKRAGKDAATATLDPALRHAARRAGWEDGEIDAFIESAPDQAEATFHRLKRSYDDLTTRYAALGAQNPGQAAQPDSGAQQPQAPASQTPPSPPATAQQTNDLLEQLYSPEDLRALRQEFDTKTLQRLVSPLLAHRSSQLDPRVQAVINDYEARAAWSTQQEISGFWTKTVPSEYQEIYGSKDATQQQYDLRLEVARLADQIRTGAAIHGEDMSVSDALEMAMHMHATPHLGAIERRKLTQQVSRRSSQRTARPTQRSGRPDSTPAKGEDAAMDAYRQRAAELGIDL